MMNKPPVITIDGPSGVGKGTLSKLLAKQLGWHYLDSGALYRVLAYAVLKQSVSPEDVPALEQLVLKLGVHFELSPRQEVLVFLDNQDISLSIRTPEIDQLASKISAIPEVRAALLQRQRGFQQPPGLVTEGRDMGTVVFPSAAVKVFLTASLDERVRRRLKQLQDSGVVARIESLKVQMQQRDERDSSRATAPLVKAVDAIELNTDGLSAAEAFKALQVIVSKGLGTLNK
jgi:cytidylate kinase